MYSEFEKEPLPLALHHSPIAVTLGVFKAIEQEDEDAASGGGHLANVFILDPW